jgi:hypothetical protein
MSVTISIYDFFAYTIPGALYLFTVLYACAVLGFLEIDWLSLDLSLVQIIIAAGLAYILGLIFEPIAKLVYERLYKRMNLRELAFQEFQRRHPSLETRIQSEDWPALLAYIKRESMDVALDIERHNVTNLMLRNVSLGLISLSLVQLIQFALTLGLLHLILAIALAVSSIIAGKESLKFGAWFFFGIFEAIASHSLQVSSLTVWKQETIVEEGGGAPDENP